MKYTINEAMKKHIASVKESAKRQAHKTVEEVLLAQAHQAYLFKCCADCERVEFSPAEFIQKCREDTNFFDYYLAYAE